MIKRYNQFVSGVKTNEEFIMPTKSDNYSDDMKPEMNQMPKMEEEEVAVNRYTLALQELSDLANKMGLIVGILHELKGGETIEKLQLDKEINKFGLTLEEIIKSNQQALQPFITKAAQTKIPISKMTLPKGLKLNFDSPENKFLTIEGKQVIFPTETERYHIDGVKKSFKTSQEVVDYFTKEIKAQEQSQDLPEMTNQPVEMEFESKSYKSKRYKR